MGVAFGPLSQAQAAKEEVIDVNAIHSSGVAANRSGDYAAAVKIFSQALQHEPDQPMIKANLHVALKNLSIQLAEKGEAQAAIEACSQAMVLFPRDVTVASNLAIFFHERAVEPLGQLRIRTSMEAAQYNQLNEQMFAEALKAIETAERVVETFRLIRLAPTIAETHARIYLLQGRYHFLKEDSTRALECFEECLRINPLEARAYLDRSRVYYERKYYDDALADLQEAANILGESNPQVQQLILRLTKEAEASGVVLTGSSDFFEVEIVGGNLNQQREIKQTLKQIRREIGLVLANPTGPMTVVVDWTTPLLRVGDWLGREIDKVPSGEEFHIGANGVDIKSPDFNAALRFQYVVSLVVNVSKGQAPFWFVSGVAQNLLNPAERLSDQDSDKLAAAAENALLLGVDALAWENILGVRDPQILRMANLEAKALVAELLKMIQNRGLSQMMNAMKSGASFEQAMLDAVRLTPHDLEAELRKSLGF
jgi:tetratricopeptide (TPR) repeat protein